MRCFIYIYIYKSSLMLLDFTDWKYGRISNNKQYIYRTTSKTRNMLENAKCKKFLEQQKVENVI